MSNIAKSNPNTAPLTNICIVLRLKDLVERFESPERDAYQEPQKVLEFLGDIQGQTIMDIGASSGYFSVKLAERGAKVIAADCGRRVSGVSARTNRKKQFKEY